MRDITFRGRVVAVPECLEELTPEQYSFYVLIGMWVKAGGITPDYWRTRWFSHLVGLGRMDYTMLVPEYIAEAESLLESVVAPFLADGEPVFKTCVNLLPEYQGYRGPADWLNDISFATFVECYSLMEQAAASDEPQSSYEAVARALYHIPESEPVPELLVWHAPMLFGSVSEALYKEPIEINGKPIDFSIIFKSSGGSRADDKTGWAGIAFEVAAAGVFGNVRELDESPLWSVLMYLYKCKFEYLHEKRNSPQK